MSEEYRARSRNAVLLRDDIGRAKSTIYDLPHDGHAYGRSEPPDAEGAREVISTWASHVPRRNAAPDCQDFRRLNRMAVTDGVASASQLAEWRSTRDIRLVPTGPEGALPKVIPSDVIPSFAYGKKARPSTPISHVIGGRYAAEQDEVLAQIYQRHADEKGMPNGKRAIKLTLAARRNIMSAKSNRALAENPPEAKEPFKLSKFKGVASKMPPETLGRSASSPISGAA
mmetsp:Transcript_82878/g.239771  ORF Transcript_82878/g.239771 Transcript_82878/m.239771 type:complete len:228 (+) Transcript_82878:95-778(+)